MAVLGSSYSFGYMTPYEDAYTTIAGANLSRSCHKPVEFQNLGVFGMSLVDVYRRTDEALALHPDVLLLTIDPFDLFAGINHERVVERNDPDFKYVEALHHAQIGGWFRNHILVRLKNARFVIVSQHFIYRDPGTYAKLFLAHGDDADYLRQPLTPAWSERFSDFESILRDLAKKAQDASVPVVILVGPSEGQVALGHGPYPERISPVAFASIVSSIASRYQIQVVDPLPAFLSQPDRMDLFYESDGHTSPSGQRILGDVLSRQLLAADHGAFKGCSR